MTLIRVETAQSAYEIDLHQRRLRRLDGSAGTPRLRLDEIGWLPFQGVSTPTVREPLTIVWRISDLGVAECTQTSRVRRIQDTP